MNRMLGTKWFNFYTNVRPVIAVLVFFAAIWEYSQYKNIYLNYWWLLLSLLMEIAQIVLCILVAVKSDKDYADFVHFVKGVLLFESFNFAYQQGVQTYLRSINFATALISAVIILVICYFVWYKLNMKYFTKRLVSNSTNILPLQEIDSEEIKTMTAPQVQYCRYCGAKISGESIFCNICGSRIAEERERR